MKAGERALLPAVRAAALDALIIADGFSCREQIAQATGRLYPAEMTGCQPEQSLSPFSRRVHAPLMCWRYPEARRSSHGVTPAV
jgi:hypothetical protein